MIVYPGASLAAALNRDDNAVQHPAQRRCSTDLTRLLPSCDVPILIQIRVIVSHDAIPHLPLDKNVPMTTRSLHELSVGSPPVLQEASSEANFVQLGYRVAILCDWLPQAEL